MRCCSKRAAACHVRAPTQALCSSRSTSWKYQSNRTKVVGDAVSTAATTHVKGQALCSPHQRRKAPAGHSRRSGAKMQQRRLLDVIHLGNKLPEPHHHLRCCAEPVGIARLALPCSSIDALCATHEELKVSWRKALTQVRAQLRVDKHSKPVAKSSHLSNTTMALRQTGHNCYL